MAKIKTVYKNCVTVSAEGASKYVTATYDENGKITKVCLIRASKEQTQANEKVMDRMVGKGIKSNTIRRKLVALAESLA